jgi:protease-4
VGSIGVVSFVANMRKLLDDTKIKRHSFYTSDKLLERRFDPLKEGNGDNKSNLTIEDEEFLRKLLDDIHADFIDHVKVNRGSKINEADSDKVFSADVFCGEEVKKYGLIDEFGDLDQKMKELYPNAEIVNFSKETPIERLKERFGGRGDTAFSMQ